MNKKISLVLCIMFLCIFSFAATVHADEIVLHLPKTITPYKEEAFSVDVPFAGTLDAYIDDGLNSPITILKDQPVQMGTFAFTYNGLSQEDMPLKKATYTLHVQLTYQNQFIFSTSEIKVEGPGTALQYAIASSSSLHQGDEGWFIDFALYGSDSLKADIYPLNSQTPVHSLSTKSLKAGAHQLFWNGSTAEGTYLAQGQYTAQVYLSSAPEQVISFSFEIAQALPALSLEENNPLLPPAFEEEALQAFFKNPITVLSSSNKEQKIFENSEKGSTSIGTLYTNVQGVKVLSLNHKAMAYIGAYRIEDGAYVTGYVPKNLLQALPCTSDYGLVVDKALQQISVYYKGSLVDTLPVSTGLMEKNHLDYETPGGSFLISHKQLEIKNKKTVSEYHLTIADGFSISQIPYAPVKGKANFEAAATTLGQKATTGGIALPFEPSPASNLNAFWLWQHIPLGTKVVVLNDESSRIERIKELYPKNYEKFIYTPTVLVSQTPLSLSEEDLNQYQRTLLTFAGDCVLGGEEHTRKDPRSFDNLIAEKGFTWPFSGLVDLFSKDDMTIVNLEVVLQDHTKGKQNNKIHIFRGDPSYANMLTLGSVEQVNIANNHYIDFGSSGKKSTQEALQAAGIPYSGFESLHIFKHNGHLIGFGGIRETVYKQDKTIMEKDITRLKEAGCDVIIYACHFGKEYDRSHNELQTTIARRAIDLGANIVIGHHTHVVQGIEGYNGGVIFYGLGNFVFGGNLDLTEFDALVAQTELLFKDGAYQGVQVMLHPVLTTGTMPANDYRPILATAEDWSRILQKVQDDTPFPLQSTMFFPAEIGNEP